MELECWSALSRSNSLHGPSVAVVAVGGHQVQDIFRPGQTPVCTSHAAPHHCEYTGLSCLNTKIEISVSNQYSLLSS